MVLTVDAWVRPERDLLPLWNYDALTWAVELRDLLMSGSLCFFLLTVKTLAVAAVYLYGCSA
jgi:hypothetical protein